MVCETGRCGAKCLTIGVVVGIDDADRFLHSHLHDKFPYTQLFFWRERKFRRSLGAHGSVGVVPHVEGAQFNQSIHPSFVDEIIEVRFADARANAGDYVVGCAVVKALHSFAQDLLAAAALVADNLGSLDTNQRSHIATFTQLGGDVAGNEMAIRKHLEVAIRMAAKDFQYVGVHEGFAADNAEEIIALLIGLADDARKGFDLDFFLLGRNIDPAALTTQVTTVDDRDVEKGRKEVAASESAFMLPDRPHPLKGKIVGELPEQASVGFGEESFGVAEVHSPIMQYSWVAGNRCTPESGGKGCRFCTPGGRSTPVALPLRIGHSLACVPAASRQPRSLSARMTLQVDRDRLAAAHQTARRQLLAERKSASHWTGKLSSSPLSTATAISALVLAEQGGTKSGLPAYTPGEEPSHVDEIFRGDLSEQIVRSLHWLANQQNDDGGWGDTDRSLSNIATTMLVQAAFHLTGVPAKFADLLVRAEQYVDAQGGVAALKRRYEGDKTFAVPILTNCALADRVPWRKVSSLPFEWACLPQRFYNWVNLPVVSYAIPALVAVGQAKFHHAPPRNPLVRWIRAAAIQRSLGVLEQMQPANGGFLEATPLTSFVVMSLASTGQSEHVVVRRGVEFLLASVREDGSWPIDSNLATWNTSQALSALEDGVPDEDLSEAYSWLLGCQHREPHPFTGAKPGGWAWTDLSGGVPDADDTAAALLALAGWYCRCPEASRAEIKQAARLGVHWLLDMQNKDGGWPTFCRGWGKLPFDRSSSDISAHVLSALARWRELLELERTNAILAERIGSATQKGRQYLEAKQQSDGSWTPLWFGNQHHPQEANPVYGTAKILVMCEDLGLTGQSMTRRGLEWLVGAQRADGGWGPVACLTEDDTAASSVEETALAVEALMPFYADSEQVSASLEQGISWLIEAVEEHRWTEPAPIGFYFAKLWYYEQLYPQFFATRALASACRALSSVAVSEVC